MRKICLKLLVLSFIIYHLSFIILASPVFAQNCTWDGNPNGNCSIDECGYCQKCDPNGICQPNFSDCSSGAPAPGGYCYCYCQEHSTESCNGQPCSQQAATPVPQPINSSNNPSDWTTDSLITEVGKNAERARQFLYWVFSRRPIYAAPVLAQMWSLSRNIVFGFAVLVIIAFGLGLILSRKGKLGPIFSGISSPFSEVNLPNIFLKIGLFILYVAFSYVLILGLIQISEILMRFFIERVAGCNLFNIKFAEGGTTCLIDSNALRQMEKNYTDFIGLKDPAMNNWESVKTTVLLVRLTSLTYNFLSVILLLRHVVLWFFLILSPFLAILMPFVFIRNTGWIWVGVFFQWLFYGPLVSIFLAALSKIWEVGIPYPFDFSRAGKQEGQVFTTATNIFYGGPAQALSPLNSSNYVDTYAEYVISLIMLWAAVLLPWLLLRIFRDYCCEIMESSQATLVSILDRLRGITPPPTEPLPPSKEGEVKVALPFRRAVEVPTKIHLEQIADVKKATSFELSQALKLSVFSLADIASYEINKTNMSQTKDVLNKIETPQLASTLKEQHVYSQIRTEVYERARQGDPIAQKILQATRPSPEKLFVPVITQVPTAWSVTDLSKRTQTTTQTITNIFSNLTKNVYNTPQKITQISQAAGVSEQKVKEVLQVSQTVLEKKKEGVFSFRELTNTVSERTRISQEKVRTIIRLLAMTSKKEDIKQVSQKTGVPQKTIKEVVDSLPKVEGVVSVAPPKPAVSIQDYEEVKKMWASHYLKTEVPVSEKIKTRTEWLAEDVKNITNTLHLLQSRDPLLKKKGLENVSHLLPFLLLGGFSENEAVTYLQAKLEAAKTVQEQLEREEKVREAVKKEEAETLLEVEKPAVKEEKAASLEEKMAIPLTEEKSGENSQK